ncbi:MAG: hypothetical protein OXC28_02260 [Defluviicoccus sp.]|nr:hypothetical protein [Defluviicoccus sp.]
MAKAKGLMADTQSLSNRPPMGAEVAIHLEFQEMGDGRFYVTSPDLEGFHYIVDAEDNSVDEIGSVLKVLIGEYLDTEIAALRPAFTPKDHLIGRLGLPARRASQPTMMVATMA